MTTRKKSDDKAFEPSLQRLEKIVQEMESGELSLEKMMGHFEEGQKLVALCSGKLQEVEKKIEILVKKGGEIVAEPFAAGDDGAPEGGA